MNGNSTAKIAVVIGGSAGIGQAAAIELAKREFGVVLTYRSHPEGATETIAAIEALGQRAIALPLDLAATDGFQDFAERLQAALLDTWGATTFQALVHNAGVGAAAPLGEITDEFYEGLQRVLLKGPIFLTQALAPLLADHGAVVFTTSNSTKPAGLTAGYSIYGALKGGLVVLTRYFAKELAARGIRVNSVSPGPTRTRLGGDAFERFPELIAPLAARAALGRIGEPEDLGPVIAFLADDESRWITAQDIEASGGYDL